MARTRNIRPEFFRDDRLADLDISVRLFFIGMWVLADQEGQLDYRPKKIKLEIMPLDDLDGERAVRDLFHAGMVSIYDSHDGSGKRIQILDWDYWQPATRKDDRGYESTVWRKAVLDRDGFACVQCGATEGLEAHHIKPWAKHPDSRFDLQNGLTLCRSCHKEIHRQGGL